MKRKMLVDLSSLKNSFVLDAAKFQCRIVRNMAKILLNLSVNSVVVSHSGFAGEIHTFASRAIKSSAKETM